MAIRDERIREQEKAIADLTKAAESFDNQRKIVFDREKELLDDRNAQEANVKAMLERIERIDTT